MGLAPDPLQNIHLPPVAPINIDKGEATPVGDQRPGVYRVPGASRSRSRLYFVMYIPP